jgi:hypothetical protein
MVSASSSQGLALRCHRPLDPALRRDVVPLAVVPSRLTVVDPTEAQPFPDTPAGVLALLPAKPNADLRRFLAPQLARADADTDAAIARLAAQQR